MVLGLLSLIYTTQWQARSTHILLCVDPRAVSGGEMHKCRATHVQRNFFARSKQVAV